MSHSHVESWSHLTCTSRAWQSYICNNIIKCAKFDLIACKMHIHLHIVNSHIHTDEKREEKIVKFALSACYLIQQTYINPLYGMQQVNLTIAAFSLSYRISRIKQTGWIQFKLKHNIYNSLLSDWNVNIFGEDRLALSPDFQLIRCQINVIAAYNNDFVELISIIKIIPSLKYSDSMCITPDDPI